MNVKEMFYITIAKKLLEFMPLPDDDISEEDQKALFQESLSRILLDIGKISPPEGSLERIETRRLDNKFGITNNRVVKTSNGEAIPDDEPVILFRARDYLALPTLLDYKDRCIFDGCTVYHLDLLNKIIKEFSDFSEQHPERMKQPGVTRGAVGGG